MSEMIKALQLQNAQRSNNGVPETSSPHRKKRKDHKPSPGRPGGHTTANYNSFAPLASNADDLSDDDMAIERQDYHSGTDEPPTNPQPDPATTTTTATATSVDTEVATTTADEGGSPREASDGGPVN